MIEYLFSNPLLFWLWVASLLIAITVHEFAHAWMANRLGDPTAKLRGRLSLNPLDHLDPIGTLALLFFRFGWGKPVPVDPYNLRNPRRDSALISLSGPLSNFLLAIFLAIILRFFTISQFPLSIISLLLPPIIILNVTLGVFNLLPVHPLDGGKILVGILPERTANEVEDFLNQYGLLLLIFMMFPLFGNQSLVSGIIGPIINLLLSLLLPANPLV